MEYLIVSIIIVGLLVLLIDITDVIKKLKTITLKFWLVIFFSFSSLSVSFAYAMEWF